MTSSALRALEIGGVSLAALALLIGAAVVVHLFRPLP